MADSAANGICLQAERGSLPTRSRKPGKAAFPGFLARRKGGKATLPGFSGLEKGGKKAIPGFFEPGKPGKETFPGLSALEKGGKEALPGFFEAGKPGKTTFPGFSAMRKPGKKAFPGFLGSEKGGKEAIPGFSEPGKGGKEILPGFCASKKGGKTVFPGFSGSKKPGKTAFPRFSATGRGFSLLAWPSALRGRRPTAQGRRRFAGMIHGMIHDIDKVLLRPGHSVKIEDRDHLLETLDRLDQRVPARHEGRTKDHREHFCILRYLRLIAGEDLLPLPVTLCKLPEGQDPPDFVLEWPDGRKETFELTDGSTQEYQKSLSAVSRIEDRLVLPVDINTPEKEAAQLWAEILFSAFLQKAEGLMRGRYDLDHLLLYDLTGLGLLLPLERGAPVLRQKLQDWHARENPDHRFGRISVLRDRALFLDVGGHGRILRGESPYFQLPRIRAHNEEDLKKRLRKIDRFCRENSIRHLKAFGSILGDRTDDFRDDSDLDLLVEFEPGTRVTLLDMARMERELSKLIGFKADLRTVGDLSRYFRHEVLQQAVELHASQG